MRAGVARRLLGWSGRPNVVRVRMVCRTHTHIQDIDLYIHVQCFCVIRASLFVFKHVRVCKCFTSSLSDFINPCCLLTCHRLHHVFTLDHQHHSLNITSSSLPFTHLWYYFYPVLYLCSQIVFDAYNTHAHTLLHNIRVHYHLLP